MNHYGRLTLDPLGGGATSLMAMGCANAKTIDYTDQLYTELCGQGAVIMYGEVEYYDVRDLKFGG